jgi:hypothetical protein
MGKLLISALKAKCLALLEGVRKIKALCISRQILVAGGRLALPVVDRAAWIGSMSDSIEILGDIVSPANEESEWETLRD